MTRRMLNQVQVAGEMGRRKRQKTPKLEETSFLNVRIIDDSPSTLGAIDDSPSTLGAIDDSPSTLGAIENFTITINDTINDPIDESVEPSPKKPRRRRRKTRSLKDNSVIVIETSESEDSCVEVITENENEGSVIELSDSEDLGVCAGTIRPDPNSPKRKKPKQEASLFPKTIHQSSAGCSSADNGGNSYIPSPLNKKSKKGLRPIVIDGSNVAFGHGKDQFSSLGLKICVDYFTRKGHDVKAFVPQFRRRHHSTRDSHLLDEMEKKGIVVYTPSRYVNGRMLVSYDDRFIVEYGHKTEGVIVSRDNYRDLLTENPEWGVTIASRLLMYTWVGDMIMFPQDPLGREGPTLEHFLRF